MCWEQVYINSFQVAFSSEVAKAFALPLSNHYQATPALPSSTTSEKSQLNDRKHAKKPRLFPMPGVAATLNSFGKFRPECFFV